MSLKSNFLLLLLSLLLAAQSANAVHDIEHHSAEHSDTCAVYLTIDASGAVESSVRSLPIALAQISHSFIQTDCVTRKTPQHYSSRAPPNA